MTMSTTVADFLHAQNVAYEIVNHPYTLSSLRSAEEAHVTGEQMVKAVLLKDGEGYRLAVLPATHRLDLGKLHRRYQRQLGLATEDEVAQVMPDCTLGALPPLGAAYGLPTVVEESLLKQPELYFEAGSHVELVHVSGEQFRKLMDGAEEDSISHHM